MAAARFPRHVRLTLPREFEAVFERGSRFTEGRLTALVAENAQAHPRLGLAISKKSAVRATDRNRVKRQVRDTFRQNQERLPAADIVVLGRAGAGTATSREMRGALLRLWDRIAATCAPA